VFFFNPLLAFAASEKRAEGAFHPGGDVPPRDNHNQCSGDVIEDFVASRRAAQHNYILMVPPRHYENVLHFLCQNPNDPPLISEVIII
jgi:hypothetical protein